MAETRYASGLTARSRAGANDRRALRHLLRSNQLGLDGSPGVEARHRRDRDRDYETRAVANGGYLSAPRARTREQLIFQWRGFRMGRLERVPIRQRLGGVGDGAQTWQQAGRLAGESRQARQRRQNGRGNARVSGQPGIVARDAGVGSVQASVPRPSPRMDDSFRRHRGGDRRNEERYPSLLRRNFLIGIFPPSRGNAGRKCYLAFFVADEILNRLHPAQRPLVLEHEAISRAEVVADSFPLPEERIVFVTRW